MSLQTKLDLNGTPFAHQWEGICPDMLHVTNFLDGAHPLGAASLWISTG